MGVDGHPLSGNLWGYATQSALEHTVDQLRTVVPSIAVTVAMLSGYRPPSYTTPDGGFELYWSEEKQEVMVKHGPTAYAEEAAAELIRHIEIGVAPPFTALVSNESRRLFDACLRACFLGTGSSKSSMSSRVNNAVLLLAEADSQRTAAISLSLSFAAIEALVCTRTEGTTEELARKTAALLQPTAMDRPEAICAIRQLYKHRCNALHGTSLDNDWVQGSVIRKLAAAVLKAVIEWISHCDRLGEKPTAEAFHRELNNAEMTGSRMVGVPDQLRECLLSS